MATSFDLTSYYAKRIIGDSAATTSGTALLQSGVNDSMWIFGHSRTNYGIKYLYDSTTNGTADKIEFHSHNSTTNTDTVTAWIQLDNGNASFNGTLGIKSTASGSNYYSTITSVEATGDRTWTIPNVAGPRYFLGTTSASYTTNSIAYAAAATYIGFKASANGALYATADNGALSWGTLPIGQGGTGATTWAKGGIVYASAADTFAQITDGTANKVLKCSGSASYEWLSYTKDSTANTLVYRDASKNFSAGTITATLSGNASTATAWASAQKTQTNLGTVYGTGTGQSETTINGGQSSVQSIGITGTLGVGHGGTGTSTAPTQWGVIYASSTSAYSSTGQGTAGYPLIGKGSAAPGWYAGLTLSGAGTSASPYNASFSKNVSIGGTLGVTGAATLSSTLGVTGNTTLSGTLGVTGATTLSSTLSVADSITLSNTGTDNSKRTIKTTSGKVLIIDSGSTLYINRTNASILFQYEGVDKCRLDKNSYFIPETNDTLQIGSSSRKWNAMYATTFNGALAGNASTATKWKDAQTVYVTLGTASTTTTLQGGSSSAQTIGVNGTLGVGNGGTGTSTAPTQWGIIYASSTSAYASTSAGAAGQVLIGQGTGTNKAPIWYGGLTLSGAGTSASPYTITLSGATTITGHLSMKINDTVDITQANNGISDNNSRVIMYTDKNGRYVARTYGRANASGSCTLFLHAGNYYNSAQKYEGISITLDKEGNCTYGVSDPANFRSTIGLGTAATHAHGDYATSSHTHGNVTNAGALQTTDITIANGDKIVVTDSSDSSKIARTSIAFDASTATKCLTQKGTWEEFNNYSHPTTAGNKHIPSGGSTGQFLKYSSAGTATWSALPEASSSTAGIVLLGATDGAATYGHTHGNITNAGALQTTDITLASGDKLVVTDSSNSNKVARASISFDGSTATKCLTQKGTWEDFNNYSHPTTAGNKHIPSGGSTGQFLKYSSSGTATWSALPDATSSVAGITLLGASGGAATYEHTHNTYLDLTAGNTSIVTGNIFIRSAETKGTTVSSQTNRQIIFLEASGTAVKNRIGYINAYQPKNTTHQRIGFAAYKNAADSTSYTYFSLSYDSDGTTRTYTDALIYGAVWNDYAEFRTTNKKAKPGQVVIDKDDGSLEISSTRLQLGASVVSDTFGFAIGETEKAKTPLAVSGRVLVYTYRPREEYHAGMAVCSAPNGTIDIMTREEIREYPDAIVGIVSEIPEYEVWGQKSVKVDNRIWIKVR